MNKDTESPIDNRRAQQSEFTSGDQDTGLPLLEHGEPQIPTEEEREIGRAAIAKIRDEMNARRGSNIRVRGPGA